MKTQFLVLSIILLLSSCTLNDERNFDDSKPYFQFEKDDRNKLLSELDLNEEIVYRNQDNQQLKFKVCKFDDYKKGEDLFSGGFGPVFGNNQPDFYYDSQEVELLFVDEPYLWDIIKYNLKRYPINYNATIYPPIFGASAFSGYINFPFWNGYNGTDTYNNSILLNFSNPTITMNFNGVQFRKVLVLESNKTEILNPNNIHPRNVNKIYYDYNKGIIGFDDLNNNQWRSIF